MKTKLFHLFIYTFVSLILFANMLAIASNVMIQADKQDYNSDKNLMTFEGNVKVDYENITVKSPKAVIQTDNSGNPQQATFLDYPIAVKDKGKLKSQVQAEIIKLSLLEKRIKAEGSSNSIVFEDQKPLVVINADDQIFDTETNVISASGNVKINYTEIQTESDYAQISIDEEGNPRQVMLKGNAKLFQENNVISADSFVYNIKSNELIAQGNVHSQRSLEDKTTVSVWSRTQEYNQSSKTLMASGKVKIKYKDYTASGPKATFFPEKKSASPNKIVFIGRANIKENDRTVEADKIEITVDPKKFKAEGNVKTSLKNIKELPGDKK